MDQFSFVEKEHDKRNDRRSVGFGLVPGNYNSYVVDNIAAVTTADAVRAAQRVLRTDAIPASPSSGAALHAAAQFIANGKSRSALAVFSARQNIL